ncbi:MAG: TIGR02594 family protein [Bacteroidota bacterium]
MDKLIQIAVNELGQKEISGPAENPSIVRFAREGGNFAWKNEEETPWCSIFVNWCAKKAGLKSSGLASARSWLVVGTLVESPQPGDVVVFWRESRDSWKGHVGFFFGFSKDGLRVFCLGGNQGNQVSISSFGIDQVLGYRRLSTQELPVVPDKILKRGDKGDAVKQLQQALKQLSFDIGTTDGDFGPRTETAVRLLQSMGQQMPVTGVFDRPTYILLVSLLNQ